MARKRSMDQYENLERNRGEARGKEFDPISGYQFVPPMTEQTQERAIRRREVRNVYGNMYRNEQERDQRAFARIRDIENEFYAGLDPRRRQEAADAGMIREDHRAIANLPEQPLHFEFPKSPYYSTPYIDDTIRGSDDVLDNS